MLSLLCGDKACDVTLSDQRFSTCEQETGNDFDFYGGVGYSADVPINSIGNFRLGLYGATSAGGTIDLERDEPTTMLTGNIDVLSNNQLLRTGV